MALCTVVADCVVVSRSGGPGEVGAFPIGVVVVGRAGDRDLLDDRPPPTTAAYLGHDADPVLDGWETHQAVYAALEPYRIGML